MSNSKEYNGFKSYETWLVSLWLDNEQGYYDYWREEARNCIRHSNHPVHTLADQLKQEIEYGIPDQVEGFYMDLMQAALSEVVWDDIAENFIDEIKDDITSDEDADETSLFRCPTCGNKLIPWDSDVHGDWDNNGGFWACETCKKDVKSENVNKN